MKKLLRYSSFHHDVCLHWCGIERKKKDNRGMAKNIWVIPFWNINKSKNYFAKLKKKDERLD